VTESVPVLAAGEKLAAEAVLARAWGDGAEVRAVEQIWDRAQVVRVELADGRSVVLKRRGDPGDDAAGQRFDTELAALELLSGMPAPVAPRLLGADPVAGILVMEDLGQGASLADSLLTGGRERAEADLAAYARALASMHAWTMPQAASPASRRAHPALQRDPEWLTYIAEGKEPFLAAVARLGLSAGGVAAEIDQIIVTLRESSNLGLVHDDPCPDNVLLTGGVCRILDFEASGWGAVVLDAGYLLAPFPSCWCFANLPAEVGARAVEAYHASLQAGGIRLDAHWEAEMLAALAGFVVARGGGITKMLDEDPQWGTTTMRPRLLAWLRNFTGRADGQSAMPRLRALLGEMHDQLSSRWPETRVPEYPALARPGSEPVPVPDWWPPRPGLQVDP
jgi:aminoglycoside/choline kinase family phosphotransferase